MADFIESIGDEKLAASIRKQLDDIAAAEQAELRAYDGAINCLLKGAE